MIVAIEGGDQAGKRTQAGMLAKELERRGASSETLSFPRYGTPAGRQIRALLRRRAPRPQLLHLLLAANRWECAGKIQSASISCDYVILDRYVHSNEAYGAANGMDRAWLRALDRGLPEPDRVVLLDIEPGVARARKTRKRDAFERDPELAQRVFVEYRRMARRKRWKRVDASGGRAEVHAAVLEALGL